MAEAKRDQNRVTGLLLEDDTTGLPVPALRDSAGRLKTIGVIANDTSIQKIIVSAGGTTIGTRQQLNFIEGTHINFTGVDNAGANRVDLTIESTVFDATVGGTGDADYTTLASAIAAGHKRIHVMTSTTEVANSNLTADADYYFFINPSATVAMGAFYFEDLTTAVNSVTIRGGGTISYAHTVANTELFNDVFTEALDIDGLTITNTSSADGCKLAVTGAGASPMRLRNLVFNLPNQDRGGIENFTEGSFFDHITLNGGGSACEQGMFVQHARVSNLYINGNFITAASGDAILIELCVADNIYLNHTTNPIGIDINFSSVTNFWVGGDTNTDVELAVDTLTNLYTDGSGVINVNGAGRLTNFFLNGGDLDPTSSSKISNGVGIGTLGPFGEAEMTNCEITGAVTTSGNNFIRNKFTNCVFLGGFTIATHASPSNDIGFVNCQFGAMGGGGAATLTIQSGVLRTRVVSCMTDAAISDSGTGTVMSANTIY